MIKYLLLVFFCTVVSATAYSQINSNTGKEFYLGYMSNMYPSTSTIAITTTEATTVRVEIPLSDWTETIDIAQNSSTEIELPIEFTQASSSGTYPFGVYINSDNPISVYAINMTGASDDATVIFPVENLGYQHFVCSWIETEPHTDISEFIIVSTKNETEIEIVYPSGNIETISLDRGELFQKHATTDLSGTKITSICNSKGVINTIAVFSGARATTIGNIAARDHLYCQLQNVEDWGKEFIINPIPYANDFFIKIISANDNTTVNINGSSISLNAGDVITRNQIGDAYISSDEKISVFVFTRGLDFLSGGADGDPTIINISPLDQGVYESRFYSFDDNWVDYPQTIQICTKTSNATNITLDNNPVTGWSTVSSNTDYSNATITLPEGSTHHKIISTNDSFTAVASAQLHAKSYAYSIGFNTSPVNLDFEIEYINGPVNYQEFEDTVCSCEPVEFSTNYNSDFTDILWVFSDGFTTSENTFTHEFSNGSHTVSLNIIDPSGCVRDSVVKQKLFVRNCDINMEPLSTICPDDSVKLTSVSGTEFLWSTGEIASSIYVTPNQTTTYSLQVNGGSIPICDEITVFVHNIPQSALNDTIGFCINTEITLVPEIEGYYLWSTGETNDSIVISQEGSYWYKITDTNNCVSVDSIYAQEMNPVEWSFNDFNFVCQNQTATIGPIEILPENIIYNWNNEETSQYISVTDTGFYYLEIKDEYCITYDSTYVHDVIPPFISIDNNYTICGNSLTIDVFQDNSSYLWSTGDTTSNITVKKAGVYKLDLTNKCGSITEFFTVAFDCNVYVPNTFTPNGDGINDTWIIRNMENFPGSKINVFNRWGQKVWSGNYTEEWDGKFNGKKMPTGNYIYAINLNNEIDPIKGIVCIMY